PAMKRILFSGMFTFSAALLWGMDRRESKARICLEEEELTLLNNGKVISKQYVSKRGPEKAAILNEAKKKIFTRLEVQTEEKPAKKTPPDRSAGESEKILKVKQLSHPRLRFYAAGGNVKKELSLGIGASKIRNTDAAGRVTISMTSLVLGASVSKDRQYALLTEDHSEHGAAPSSTGKIKYYNVNGDLIWEKQHQKFRLAVGSVSDDGSKIFLIKFWRHTLPSLPATEPERQFAVYGKTGKNLLLFPKTRGQEGGYQVTGVIVPSPNARYVAVKADRAKEPVWLFFDIADRSFWVYDELRLSVIDISDQGLCNLGFSSGAGFTTIDLKKKKFAKLN
ncbi:MAG: hypothetical protein KKH28_13585, partial [Elusimicrobia bacterium]|nr:hypothetical protein [Elusimicrobiota bacterium]